MDDAPDDHAARAGLIECQLFVGDFAGAKELCLTGMALVPNTPLASKYAYTLARVLLAWYDARSADSKVTAEERFALLEQAMNLVPEDPNVLQRLVVFTRMTGAEAEKPARNSAN